MALLSVFTKTTRVRRESNRWLRRHSADVNGAVLSVGSGADLDGEGRRYRDYFAVASSYTTSEYGTGHGCDRSLDVTNMPAVASESYDAVFCSGVLEHVEDYEAALREMTRILRPGGILLLGVPFHQPIHNAPRDFWRFTDQAIRYLLAPSYDVIELDGLDNRVKNFPASWWAKARKRTATELASAKAAE
jgi:SAM-dependent methyltransferase